MNKDKKSKIFNWFRNQVSWYLYFRRGEVVNSRYLLHRRDLALRIYNEALNRGAV